MNWGVYIYIYICIIELLPYSSYCVSITEIWAIREAHGESLSGSNKVIEGFVVVVLVGPMG